MAEAPITVFQTDTSYRLTSRRRLSSDSLGSDAVSGALARWLSVSSVICCQKARVLREDQPTGGLGSPRGISARDGCQKIVGEQSASAGFRRGPEPTLANQLHNGWHQIATRQREI